MRAFGVVNGRNAAASRPHPIAISARLPRLQATFLHRNAAQLAKHRIFAEVRKMRQHPRQIGCMSLSSPFVLPFQDDAASADASPENGTTASVIPMAKSLIERAEEVANSGVVDDQFRDTFVQELKAELEQLQSRAESAELTATALEDNLKSAKEQYVRLSADFENFRKRSANERDALKTTIKGDTLSAMLPLIDNFELAKSQLKLETEGEKKIDAAYQGLYKQMVELFRGLGLEAVSGAGEPFDPELHEAIMREPNDDVPDGTVLEEFRKGFRLGDRLLRPAMVKVSFSDAVPAAAAASGTSEDETISTTSDEEEEASSE